MLSALRDDALSSTTSGFAVRVGLPWIRSLPIACLRDVVVTVDESEAPQVRLRLGQRSVAPEQLLDESGWWFAQDRLVLEGDRTLTAGDHELVVSFRLLIPYLMAGPGGGPLELPIRLSGRYTLDHVPVPSVSLDVA
jgi:hypothetical protein